MSTAPGNEAVVVLGMRNAGRRANYVNRYRVRAGIRSLDPAAASSVLILCGGAVIGDIPEADLMESYARRELGYTGPVLLDRTSRSTWENIKNATPLVENADSIKIVSNSPHAERARAYFRKLRPELADRLRRGEDYRFGEIGLIKPIVAFVEIRKLRAL